jgi:hypothetical protein
VVRSRDRVSEHRGWTPAVIYHEQEQDRGGEDIRVASQSGRGKLTSLCGETSGRNARMWRGTLSAQPNTSLHRGSMAGGAVPGALRRYAPARNFLTKESTCREGDPPLRKTK